MDPLHHVPVHLFVPIDVIIRISTLRYKITPFPRLVHQQTLFMPSTVGSSPSPSQDHAHNQAAVVNGFGSQGIPTRMPNSLDNLRAGNVVLVPNPQQIPMLPPGAPIPAGAIPLGHISNFLSGQV